MNTKYVSEIEIDAQKLFTQQCRELLLQRYGRTPKALVHSFG